MLLTRARRILSAVAVLTAVAACGGGPTPSPAPAAASGPPTDAGRGSPIPAATAAGPALHGPRIVLVIEENHSLDQVVGSPSAPALNRLVSNGTLLSQFYATRHPSLPNYIALLAGDTYGIVTDCGDCSVSQPTLVDQLEHAQLSWRAYLQGLPSACAANVRNAGAYAKKHNPFAYFPAITADPSRCRNLVPFDQFADDARSGRLPQVVWVTPDLAHDMHGLDVGEPNAGRITAADTFLGELYDTLQSSPAWQDDTRMVVTWDEGAGGQQGDHGCCEGAAVGGHVATVVVGPRVPHGTDGGVYDHYALLRSVETALGLPYLAHAADAVSKDIPAVSAAR